MKAGRAPGTADKTGSGVRHRASAKVPSPPPRPVPSTQQGTSEAGDDDDKDKDMDSVLEETDAGVSAGSSDVPAKYFSYDSKGGIICSGGGG